MARIGQARAPRLSSVSWGDQPQSGMDRQDGRAGKQQQLHAHKHPDRARRVEQTLEARQIDPTQREPAQHLDRQGAQPQRFEAGLEGTHPLGATFPQGYRQHSEIEQQVPAGPDRGGQGMDDDQKRK